MFKGILLTQDTFYYQTAIYLVGDRMAKSKSCGLRVTRVHAE